MFAPPTAYLRRLQRAVRHFAPPPPPEMRCSSREELMDPVKAEERARASREYVAASDRYVLLRDGLTAAISTDKATYLGAEWPPQVLVVEPVLPPEVEQPADPPPLTCAPVITPITTNGPPSLSVPTISGALA